MLNLSRLGAVRALFFKSEQFQLIDMPIHIGASVDKHGHVKAAHTRIQKVRVPVAPVQHSLFGDDEAPKKDKHSARLDAFIRKHGGLGNLAHLMGGMTEGQQQRIFGEMAKLGGKSITEVSAMFDGVKAEAPAQADLFSAPAVASVPEVRRDSGVIATTPEQVTEESPELVEYTTKKGKVLRGIVRKDLTRAEAKEIDEYTFPHAGGFFIREKHLSKPPVPKVVERSSNAEWLAEDGSDKRNHLASMAEELVLQIAADLKDGDFDAKEIPTAIDIWANDARLPTGDLKDAVIVELDKSKFVRAKDKATIKRVLTKESKITPVIAENPQNSVENEPVTQNKADLDYPAFKAKYQELFSRMMSYSMNEAGSGIYAEKMAELADAHPEFSARIDAEAEGIQNSEGASSQPFGVQAGITKQARVALNAQARDLINRGAPFTDDDKAILRQYSGNGGCGDSLNEFYTLPEVAGAMWAVAQRLGIKGDVLEPSCGPGVFLHTAPAAHKVTGVEWDDTSARIAKILHGDRHEIQNSSLERFSTQDARQFGAVLGNVPFGLRGGLIKDDKPGLKTADAYFCDTSMDKCEAGGIVGLIVPTGIMDSKTNRKLREMMLRKGQFLGAQRMPNTAFEHSHTGVTTDVIWFRKYPDDVAGALSSKAVTQDHLKSLNVWDDEFLAGGYFTGRGAENVLGTMGQGWRAKAGMGADITVDGSMDGVPEAIRDFLPEESKPMPAVTDILTAVGIDEKSRAVVLGGAMNRPYADKSKAGDTKTVDGIVYVLQGHPPRWHRIDEVLQSEALTQGQDIAARIETLMAGSGAVDRPSLEKDLRAWIEAHGIPSKNKDVLLGAQQDKSLYRLIGAVKSNGELSDSVMGKAAVKQVGSFEATVQSMLMDHETVAAGKLAKSAGIDEESALDQLYGSPKYAIDAATGEWTSRDIFLSGDLWSKSDATKLALAGELPAEMRKKLEQQAVLLNEAIAPVSLEDAFIQVNSAFLPPSVLAAFLNWKNHEGPNANKWTKEKPPISIEFGDGVYSITGGDGYGETHYLDQYLNRSGLRKDNKHVIDDMNVEFKDWLCASAEYREMAEDLYNRKFRGFAEREFSNEPMDIPGMNTEGLKDYQWGGLRWALNAGKGIIAADVGLGKTARALMLARTLKTTGQAKRPMIVVPKSVLSNWKAECEKWFPGSKVLAIGEKGDNPAERKRKYHDMQQNDYDFILCSEPSFEEIDLDPSTKGEYNAKDFWVQRGDKMGNAGDKRANKIKEAWEQARAGQEFSDGTRTDATYFNQLGVDALIHDEFHHQKNLCSIKSRFGESPKFLGGGGQSMRSLDFNLKARWLLDQQGGKNVYGLTATPTKNSPIEIYAMLSHVAPEAFERIGVRNSEEFLDRFAKFEDGMALTTGGVMEDALITKGFQNMDELRGIMKRYIHRQTAEEVGLKLPERQDITHMIQMDHAQEVKYSELRELAAESGGKDSTGDAHIFSIMDKMNKTAVDLSLVDDSYDGTKSPKYTACAQEVIKGMKDGGQIVFTDYVESHEKIVAALVKSGVPRDQIGIINAKAAKTSEARQKICDQFNEGKLKVVIGNTATMGEGLNLQKGTSDIHHLDLPWEPASMQQRNGRGLRQGNTNLGVRIHSYLAKGSFDGYRLQSILAKKDWQDMIWRGGNEVENLNQQGNISRDEMMIMLAADPDQAREAFEANHKAKEERLIAGKTADAAQRFVKFQETKRSYGTLKDKNSQSAARLKAKMDKDYSSLKHDKYFTTKQALDMETPVIVSSSGALLHAGAGIEAIKTGSDKSTRYVVTAVDQRRQKATIRVYGDTVPSKITVDVKDLGKLQSFAYDEAVETEEIGRKIASQPMVIKQLSDVMKLPPVAINANHDALQKQIWEGAKNYSISLGNGKVALVEKATGKPVITEYYNVSLGKGDISQETHDFLLPTEENKAKAENAWMDAERASKFGTDTNSPKRGRSTTTAKRKYGVLEHGNPWKDIVETMSGQNVAGYYGGLDSPPIKAVRQKFVAEQMERIKHAPTLMQAIDEAAAIGEVNEAQQGYSASVKMPKKVIATLWAKARKLGQLGFPIDDHVTRTTSAGGYASDKHSSYFLGGSKSQKSVHSILLGLAAKSGHSDLVHAMVESGIRHGIPHAKSDIHDESIRAIAVGWDYNENTLLAIQKLAGKAGILDRERREFGSEYGALGSTNQWAPQNERAMTIGDRLTTMIDAKRAQKAKAA
jgi:hypothetical protein